MPNRRTTPSEVGTEGVDIAAAEARWRQFLSLIIDKLRLRVSEMLTDGSRKQRWTLDKLLLELVTVTRETANPALVGTIDEFSAWSRGMFDATSSSERKAALGDSVSGGAIGSASTWERLIRTWNDALATIALKNEELRDVTGARRNVTAELRVIRRRGNVAIYAVVVIDGKSIPVDPWKDTARIAARGERGARRIILEWFASFLDSIPLQRVVRAAEAVAAKKPVWAVIGILLGVSCTLGAIAYYRATHHIHLVGEPSSGMWWDSSHAPTPSYVFCWESNGNEPVSDFHILRDGRDVTQRKHLWAEGPPKHMSYCYEDRTIVSGSKYVYRIAVGSGLRQRISGPVNACVTCALENERTLDLGIPLVLQDAQTNQVSKEPGLALVNVPRTFSVNFARNDQDGQPVDPSSLSDAPSNEPVLANYGEGRVEQQPADKLVHTFTTLGHKTVIFSGTGRYVGNTRRYEVNVIDKARGTTLVYRASPDHPMLIKVSQTEPASIIVFTKAHRKDNYQFLLSDEMVTRLNRYGGTVTLTTGSDVFRNTVSAGGMAGHDAIGNYVSFRGGRHSAAFELTDGLGAPLFLVRATVHALP